MGEYNCDSNINFMYFHGIMDEIWQFLRDNAVWITPVLVAIVSGLFLLLSRKSKGIHKNKQVVKKAQDSIIIQNNSNNGD